MKCQVFRDDTNKIIRVEDRNGNESKLFNDLVKLVKDVNKAYEIWDKTYSKEFTEWYGSKEPVLDGYFFKKGDTYMHIYDNAPKINNTTYYSPIILDEQQKKALETLLQEDTTIFEHLTYLQASQVIQDMTASITKELQTQESVNLVDVIDMYKEDLTDDLEFYKEQLEEANEEDVNAYETLVKNHTDTLADFDNIVELVKSNLKTDDKYKLDDKGEVYDIQTFEVNPKAGLSKKLKTLLTGIKNDDKLNYLGREEYIPFDTVYNTIVAILSDSEPDRHGIIDRLKTYQDAVTWIPEVIRLIERMDEQTLNSFISSVVLSQLQMKYVLYDPREGTYRLIDTNSNDIQNRIQSLWTDGLKGTTLFNNIEDGKYFVNIDEYNRLAEWYKSKQQNPSIDDVDTFFKFLSIELSEKTLDNIGKYGLYIADGKKQTVFDMLNNKAGIVNVIMKDLNHMLTTNQSLDIKNPINQSVIKKLIKYESRFNKGLFKLPNTFRTGEKQVYSYIAHTEISDRVKDLKSGKIIDDLLSSNFTKHSKYLQYLTEDSTNGKLFRENFGIYDTDLEALKVEKGSDSQKFNNMSETEMEITRLGHYLNNRSESSFKNGVRLASYVLPTMSDKSRTLVFTGFAYENNEQIWDILYDTTVLPELERILAHKDVDIKAYNTGAKLFNFLPELNLIELESKPLYEVLNKKLIHSEEGKRKIKDLIIPILKNYVADDVKRKQETFKRANIEHAVKDIEGYVINNMIAIAEAYMLFIGDPAMFYKSKVIKNFSIDNYSKLTKDDVVKISKDTFINVGKRLAMLIAPGKKLSNSNKNTYQQLMLADRETKSVVSDYLQIMLGDDYKDYTDIEGTDAQEFTTWQEHLYVLEKLGEIEAVTNLDGEEITQDEINKVRTILSKEQNLTAEHRQLLTKLMQPMKPVYSGQVKQGDNMRVMYIKSSSFPLIPQLTKGLEIDKLRKAMESLQANNEHTIRVSFTTANKVGSVEKPINIWNEDGTIIDLSTEDNLNKLNKSSIFLPRSNFRIQQPVPFKSGKKEKQDTVNVGTQERKLLFSNILSTKGFNYNGKEYTGKELKDIYDNLYDELFQLGLEELYNELNIDTSSDMPISKQLSVDILAKLLQKEAKERNYPLSDIKGLEIVDDSFVLPLWLHQSSDRYESLLNSIVSNRVIQMKFPGYSYVLGTEEGFKVDTNSTDLSNVIFTSSWEGELKPARFVLKSTGETIIKNIDSYKPEEIEFKPSQVIAPMKLRDENGKLINLLDTDKNGNYKYLTKDRQLDTTKINSKLLKMFGFRIPTSGLMSLASIEIVGFLPYESGDVLIASRDFTKQMGSDFDVDKLYSYVYPSEAGRLDLSTKRNNLISKIIDIHFSVLEHKSNHVQSQIHRPLGFGVATDTANAINAKRDVSDYKFTPLSTEYQKEKMMSGSYGKQGTGVYSLDVVFHTNCQSLLADDTAISIKYKDEDDKVKQYQLNIAGVVSHEQFGHDKTVNTDGRYISDVLSEAQNYSVDNEKEQIMGKVNDNNITFNARKIMNGLGLDLTESTIALDDTTNKRLSLVNLFMSQSILFDYLVPMVQSKQSVLADYDADVMYNAMSDILDLDVFKSIEFNADTTNNILANVLKEQDLYNMLGKSLDAMTDHEKQLQLAILYKFIELDTLGNKLASVQKAINTDSKKLGKSLFENINKYNDVINLTKGIIPTILNTSTFFTNLEKTVGQYSNVDNGGVKIHNSLWIKPKGVNGYATVYGLMSSVDLYEEYFIGSNKTFNFILNELALVTNRQLSLKDKFNVLKAFKSYTYNSKYIQNTTDDINVLRRKLFIDSDTNKSLARYIKEQIAKHPRLELFAVMNGINLSIEANGLPSKITWNNSATNEFENQFYLSFLEMLQDTSKLDNYQGNEMTVQSLAQHMITYAYLEGGIQEATQFIRHIPLEYLKVTPIAERLRTKNYNNPNSYGGDNNIYNTEDKQYASSFVEQYIQHNPKIVSEGDETVKDFIPYIKDLDGNKLYKSFYDTSLYKKGIKNSGFKLYKLQNGDNGYGYYRLPNLGVFGMKEYNADNNTVQQSLVHTIVEQPNSIIPRGVEKDAKQDILNTYKKDKSKDVLENIAKSNTAFSNLAKEYLMLNKSNKIVYVKDKPYFGQYDAGIIYINEELFNQPLYKIEQVFMEEVTHALTLHQLASNVDAVKPIIKRLSKLYNKAVEVIKKEYGEDAISNISKKLEKGKSLTGSEFTIYGGISLEEFVAQLMTNKDLQELLSKTLLPTSKQQSFWDKIKKLLNSLIKKLLLIKDVDYNSITAVGVTDIMELIKTDITPQIDGVVTEVLSPKTDNLVTDVSHLKTIQEKLETLYPEIKLTITENPQWEQEGNNIFNQKDYNNQIQYRLKAVDVLMSDKAKQMFAKGKKNKWSLDKILTEIQIPKQQKDIILTSDFGEFYTNDLSLRENIIMSLLAENSFVVEINTAKKQPDKDDTTDGFVLNNKYYRRGYGSDGQQIFEVSDITDSENFQMWEPDTFTEPQTITKEEYLKAREQTSENTEYYSNLTVPGGTNYTEQNFETPLIKVPKSHAQFNTENTIGFSRSDDKIIYDNSDIESLLQTMENSGILKIKCN